MAFITFKLPNNQCGVCINLDNVTEVFEQGNLTIVYYKATNNPTKFNIPYKDFLTLLKGAE
jgi:hypothetical protein